MHTDMKYLSYVDYRVNFRSALDLQVDRLAKAIESENPDLYQPICIR